MKKILPQIIGAFWQSKGILHLIVAMAFIYDFMYWGAIKHDNPILVWNDAPATLYHLGAIKYLFYTLIIFGIAFAFELLQKDFFNAIPQWSDVFCSALGAPLAFILWHYVPESGVLFWIFLVITLAPIVQFIYWLIKKHKK